MAITYGKSEVTIPSDAKSISGLIDDVVEKIQDLSKNTVSIDY